MRGGARTSSLRHITSSMQQEADARSLTRRLYVRCRARIGVMGKHLPTRPEINPILHLPTYGGIIDVAVSLNGQQYTSTPERIRWQEDPQDDVCGLFPLFLLQSMRGRQRRCSAQVRVRHLAGL